MKMVSTAIDVHDSTSIENSSSVEPSSLKVQSNKLSVPGSVLFAVVPLPPALAVHSVLGQLLV